MTGNNKTDNLKGISVLSLSARIKGKAVLGKTANMA